MSTQVWMGSLLALGLLACGGPEKVVIQGEITGLPDSTKILLYNMESEKYLDSTWMIDGRFQLQSCLEQEPQTLWLTISSPSFTRSLTMTLGNERVKVKGDVSDFPYWMQISGSKYQDQMTQLDVQTAAYSAERDSLVLSVVNVLDDPQYEQQVETAFQRVSEIDRIVDSIQKEYLFTYTDTYPSLSYLKYHIYYFPKDTVKMLFDRMSPELQACSWAKRIRTYLESGKVAVGDSFMDFEAEDQNGNQVRLSDFVGKDGKYVLLDFTSAGCGPCIMANKEMRQMVDTYSDSLQIVSFSQDRSRETWLNAVQRDSICWPSLWSAENADRNTISIPYRVQGVPAFFVIDPQGKIIQRWGGYGQGIFDKKIGSLKNQQ